MHAATKEGSSPRRDLKRKTAAAKKLRKVREAENGEKGEMKESETLK